MTALMAFFLCVWLLAQNQEVKKNVSEYFSTPSVIEYNFANYGVELTLEKLFLDLINEPFKVFRDFVTPADMTPDFLRMGTKNIRLHSIAERLGDSAEVTVNRDEIIIEIPEEELFKINSADVTSGFATTMEQVLGITSGLEDAQIYVDSKIFYHSSPSGQTGAQSVAEERLDIILNQMKSRLEHGTVDLYGKVKNREGIPGTS